MELQDIIIRVQSQQPSATQGEITQAITASGIDASLYTAAHVDALAQKIETLRNGSGLATATKSKAQGAIARSTPQVPIVTPKFTRKAQATANLEVVEATAREQGRSEVGMLMQTRNSGYAAGAMEAFEEGNEAFDTFRGGILAEAQAAMFAG